MIAHNNLYTFHLNSLRLNRLHSNAHVSCQPLLRLKLLLQTLPPQAQQLQIPRLTPLHPQTIAVALTLHLPVRISVKLHAEEMPARGRVGIRHVLLHK